MNKRKITKNFGCKIANKILYMFRGVYIGKSVISKKVISFYIQSDILAKKRWHKTNYQLFFHYNNDEAGISGFNFEHN